MDFTIEKKVFLKTLQRIQGIVEKRNTMPILSNVLIEVEPGRVTTLATDLEIFIKDSCEAAVNKEGSVTINARKLFEIIKEMPEGDIAISKEDNDRVTIKSQRVKYKIAGLPPKEFPPFPAVDEGSLKKIEPEILADMIDKTAFASSMDETRYNINGFLLEGHGSSIRMVTTDGHRLAIIDKETEDIKGTKEGVILPRKGVMEVRKLLEEKEGTYFFGFSEKSAAMKKDNTLISIRLIEGEFPEYDRIVPKDNDKVFTVKRTDLLASLKRVSILSTDKIKGVRFSLSSAKLVLSSSTPELGDATEEIDVKYEGEEIETAFNARYFIDVLEALTDIEVKMELKEPLTPGILKRTEGKDYTYVVMPMRL